MNKILLVLILFIYGFKSNSQTTEQQYLFNEWNKYFKGIYSLPIENTKATEIYKQLLRYSGMKFYIYNTESLSWGHVHNGGVILIDNSILSKPKEILAYILAHEWGHIILGHKENLFNSSSSVWEFRSASEDEEAAADNYAGEFLGTYNYDVTVVTDFIMTLPVSSKWNSHIPGRNRNTNVLAGHKTFKDNTEDNTIKENTNLHGDSKIIKCTHQAHPAGDAYPCKHICYDKLTSDKFPCHPNGDVSHCIHPLHLSGDTLK